jgi:acetate kinase
MHVLVLNSGSSSQKVCLYDIGDTLPVEPPACLWERKIESNSSSGREQALQLLRNVTHIDVVGHRVVHGGRYFEQPVVVTPEVKSAIAQASVFAPLHNQAALEGMDWIEKEFGKVTQVAVFDTGYHRRMPLAAVIYPGPYEWFEAGIHRYGFHGINHQYCAGRAARLLGRELKGLRLVTCHLGNGCSLAAIAEGISIDTTMGFTPLEGLMMGTRSGSVDPGVLTYLMRERKLAGEEIDAVLNYRSGLLGISGLSGDMREIVSAMNSGHSRAQLAFDIYVHRLQAGIGAMAAVLGGIDALVFTAGIGENSPEIRAAACSQLHFLGLTLDPSANVQASPDTDIATANATARILVIRAQEDWAIASECWKLVNQVSRT